MKYKRTEKARDFFELFREGHRKIDWDVLAGFFKNHPHFNIEKPYQINFYASSFLALQRMLSIERLIRANRELHVSVINNVDTGNYYINTDLSGRCFVYYKFKKFNGKKVIRAHCDNLIKIDSVPTIINFRYKEFPKQDNEGSEFFKSVLREDLAYGMVVTEDNLDERANGFRERGGYIISLPIDKKELKKSIIESCNKHKLNVLEDF